MRITYLLDEIFALLGKIDLSLVLLWMLITCLLEGRLALSLGCFVLAIVVEYSW
jgi:hypothetical protein